MKRIICNLIPVLMVFSMSINVYAYEDLRKETEEINFLESPYYDEYNDFLENGRTYIINNETVTINILDNADDKKIKADKENILKNGFDDLDQMVIDAANQLQESVKDGDKNIYIDNNPSLLRGNVSGFKEMQRVISIRVEDSNTWVKVYYTLELGTTVRIDSNNKVTSVLSSTISAYDFRDSSGLSFGRFEGGSATGSIVSNNVVRVYANYKIGAPVAGAYGLASTITADQYNFFYNGSELT